MRPRTTSTTPVGQPLHTHLNQAVRAVVDDPSLHRFVYQPIVDLQRGAVVGYEMLSRFDGPPASPDKWFAVADRLGLGPALQVRTLRHAIDQLPVLPANTFLTVNLDPKLIATDAVIAAIQTTESLDRIVIELTEQTVAADPDVMMTLLTRASGPAPSWRSTTSAPATRGSRPCWRCVHRSSSSTAR